MKKLITYIKVAVILPFAWSCADFLDKNPPDQLSSQMFWENKADFENALTAVYGSLQNSMFSHGMPNWDVLTDNGYGQHNYWGSNPIVQGNVFPSTGGYISSVYYDSYRAIARVNIFLNHLAAYEGSDIGPQERSQFEGEAKYVRAFFYSFLYMSYGSVPLVLDPLSLEDQFQPKVSDEEIRQQIITDLSDAIQQLPDVLYQNNNGHAVKSSAEALMARILLYDAYDPQGNARIDAMNEALPYLASLMAAGYQLAPDYTEVFRDGTQEGNPEILFSIKFLAPDNFTPMDQWYGDWLVVSPLQNLVDTYEYTDGLPKGQSPLQDPNDEFANRDPRLGYTVFEDHVDWGGGNTHVPSNNRPTGYGLKKFLTPDLIPYGYSTRSQQDWVVSRFGEVLLMYAEVLNELEGPSQDVYNAVNRVRGRVGMPSLPVGLSQQEMRERIRHERRVELAFEGLRFYDLKRWKTAEEVLNAVDDGVIPYNFESRFYKWPLPQSEIDRNDGILVQNPDY
ncbi:RagB/SusD family nutrient uptake outer membrane protein [Negadavirga shengliensis]|uniref:RagB/SusD family nutrient uptake outer membrane protein n=1 Tax=Negadavirga shengliensis TaxID=1389218 RepID=A0ABV9T2Z1_9BACT